MISSPGVQDHGQGNGEPHIDLVASASLSAVGGIRVFCLAYLMDPAGRLRGLSWQ